MCRVPVCSCWQRPKRDDSGVLTGCVLQTRWDGDARGCRLGVREGVDLHVLLVTFVVTRVHDHNYDTVNAFDKFAVMVVSCSKPLG